MEEASYHAKMAVEQDPLNPFLLGMSARVLIYTGESQTALAQAEKALSIEPNQSFAYYALHESYIATGDTLKWYELIKRTWKGMDEKELDSAFFEHGYIGLAKQRIKTLEEVYSKSGLIGFCTIAYWYTVVGNYEKAMDYYEKGYEAHAPCMIYIRSKETYDKLKDNPRYIALLKKMNLPVD
jgi:tetratricopeptide (TPR) repeat protein